MSNQISQQMNTAAVITWRALAVAAALWTAVATAASGAEADTAARVVMKEFMFAPAALTIRVGSAVSWTNQDNEPHTVASDAGVFRSGALDTNESFTFRFDKPGTYHFLCTIHPYMVGTITVEP
jgi:plastocyanin